MSTIKLRVGGLRCSGSLRVATRQRGQLLKTSGGPRHFTGKDVSAAIGKKTSTHDERRASVRVMSHFGANRTAPIRGAILGTPGCFVLLLTLTSCAVTSARMHDNESGAIAEVRTIQAAQTRHFAQFGRWAGSLKELESGGMLDAELSSGIKTGYRYQLTQTENGYTIGATPNVFDSTGSRSFYSDQTMGIHEHRGPATAAYGRGLTFSAP